MTTDSPTPRASALSWVVSGMLGKQDHWLEKQATLRVRASAPSKGQRGAKGQDRIKDTLIYSAPKPHGAVSWLDSATHTQPDPAPDETTTQFCKLRALAAQAADTA